MALYLANWTMDQKQLFATFLAQGRSVKAASFEVGETFGEELHRYQQSQLMVWRNSDEGRSMVKRIRAKLRRDAETRSFAHSGSRIHALVDVAEEIYNALKDMDKKKDTSKFVSLCGEFRQYMDVLRKEMVPLESAEGAALSLFERWENMRKDAEKKEWVATSEN